VTLLDPLLIRVMSLLFVSSCISACGGGRSYQGGAYVDDEASYAISQPGAGWTPLDVGGDNDLAFGHESLAAVIQVNATCDPSMDIPLPALRNHLLIGWTEREVQSEDLLDLDSREALQTHLVAKIDGVPRELALTVLKKDGCVYDFALVAPPGQPFASARGAYDAMVGSFRTR
jgi:hypothetical protein